MSDHETTAETLSGKLFLQDEEHAKFSSYTKYVYLVTPMCRENRSSTICSEILIVLLKQAVLSVLKIDAHRGEHVTQLLLDLLVHVGDLQQVVSDSRLSGGPILRVPWSFRDFASADRCF